MGIWRSIISPITIIGGLFYIMDIIFLNNWFFNTCECSENDEDFIFDFFRIEYSWRFSYLNLIICNFEIRINWKGNDKINRF